LAQEVAGAAGAHCLAEMEPLCPGRDIGGSQQITLLLGLHALGNDPDPDIAREIDNGAYRCRALGLAGGADATRILLTGEPGRDAAIDAVNKAQIFRFLTKPCPPEQLKAAVEAGVMQHRLIGAERSVLKETLIGCIKALVDVLAIANPVAFGRASRLKRLAMSFAVTLQCGDFRQLEAAALLSQIGYLSLPTELVEKLYFGEPLTPEEKTLADGVPDGVMNLLENIPRLDPVIQILVGLSWSDEAVARLGDGTIGLGTRILGLVQEYDTLITQGHSVDVAIQTVRRRAPRFTAGLIEQFGTHLGAGSSKNEAREMVLKSVQVGMVHCAKRYREHAERSSGAAARFVRIQTRGGSEYHRSR
jgi:hypothetical protein